MFFKSLIALTALAAAVAPAQAAHVHFYVDAAGNQLVFSPSLGSFNGTYHYSAPFAATGVADPQLPGLTVSYPTITTLENFDGEQSTDIANHEIGIRITGIRAVNGSPTTTLNWLITAPPKDGGEDVGNPADQLVTASLVPDGLGGYTPHITGYIDMGPLDNGVPTGNHWHGQHWTFSDQGTYDVSFQLFDLNATNGLASTYGAFADSPIYTVQFVVPEPASLGLLGLGAASLMMKRRRRNLA